MTAFDPGVTLISSASAVARRQADGTWAACLIRGAPGAGKSTLALNMLALGACLVSDDVVGLLPGGPTGVQVQGPNPPLSGLLETRDVGFLRVEHLSTAPLRFVADIQPGAGPGRGDVVGVPDTAMFLNVTVPQLRIWIGPSNAAALFCLLGSASMVDPDTL